MHFMRYNRVRFSMFCGVEIVVGCYTTVLCVGFRSMEKYVEIIYPGMCRGCMKREVVVERCWTSQNERENSNFRWTLEICNASWFITLFDAQTLTLTMALFLKKFFFRLNDVVTWVKCLKCLRCQVKGKEWLISLLRYFESILMGNWLWQLAYVMIIKILWLFVRVASLIIELK